MLSWHGAGATGQALIACRAVLMHPVAGQQHQLDCFGSSKTSSRLQLHHHTGLARQYMQVLHACMWCVAVNCDKGSKQANVALIGE
jgi:hypothetical protein